jgi:hypothetical protein
MDDNIIYEFKVEIYDSDTGAFHTDWGVVIAKSTSEACEKIVKDYESGDETITNLEVSEYGDQFQTFSIFGYLKDHEKELDTMRQAYDQYKQW